MKLNEAIKRVLVPEATTYKGGVETVSMADLHSTYDTKFAAFQNGELSEQEWQEYCTDLLANILTLNKDVMVRLKMRQF
jgi:hypothetical protein